MRDGFISCLKGRALAFSVRIPETSVEIFSLVPFNFSRKSGSGNRAGGG